MVLVDTNFINNSIRKKIDMEDGMLKCVHSKCLPAITDCVISELEKLGKPYRVAAKLAKNPRYERVICQHAGSYADDCICDRIRVERFYIVATCDVSLRRRIRKISPS